MRSTTILCTLLFVAFCTALPANVDHVIHFHDKGRPTASELSSSYSVEEQQLLKWTSVRLPNGTKFTCHIPPPIPHSSIRQIRETRAARFLSEGWIPGSVLSKDLTQLVHKQLKGITAVIQVGYWHYSVGWDAQARQFHLQPGSHATEYLNILGEAAPLNTVAEVTYNNDKVAGPYVSVMKTGGTLCPITNVPRSVEVRMFCDEESDIPFLHLEELETCKYVATLSSSTACYLPPLAPAAAPKEQIDCYRDGEDDE